MKPRIGLALLALAIGLVARAAPPPRIAIMIGEDEYHTWETLPAFADRELRPRGYEVTIIQQDRADPNRFPGLVAALRTADLLVLSVRRRTPPHDQLDALRAFLAAGKPLVGIRTACHAFALRFGAQPSAPDLRLWQNFDPEVLGGSYTHDSHSPAKSVIRLAPNAAGDPILAGVTVRDLVGNGSLYHVSPLAADTVPLLIGSIPTEMAEPVAWTRRYGPNHARIFYTSLGAPEDFRNPQFRHLLANAIDWALH